MKYSISNIAWSKEYDNEMYAFLKQQGIDGLEIAPTRIFDKPYDNLELAHEYAWMLKNKYGLTVSSMQSIWYGVKESIFGTDENRAYLLDYTKKAILFAESMGIRNLVFGCPRNRNMPQGDEKQFMEIAAGFFKELGDFAYQHNTVLAMEPNPVIYNTNFLNYTKDACEFVKSVDSPGFKVNIDMGTIFADMPVKVQLKVTYTEPGIKGDTATNTLKPATVESGAEVRVPLFIEEGEIIEINTQDGSYVGRIR